QRPQGEAALRSRPPGHRLRPGTGVTASDGQPPWATSDPSGWGDRITEAMSADVSPRRVELRRMGEAMRRVIGRLVATEAPDEELARAADILEELAADFDGYGQRDLFEGFSETANAGDPHAFFDHSPIIGRANPLAPPIHLEVRGDKVHG